MPCSGPFTFYKDLKGMLSKRKVNVTILKRRAGAPGYTLAVTNIKYSILDLDTSIALPIISNGHCIMPGYGMKLLNKLALHRIVKTTYSSAGCNSAFDKRWHNIVVT